MSGFCVEDWGLVSYSEAWERQKFLEEAVKNGSPSVLVLVEHPAVISVGPGHAAESFRLPKEAYPSVGIELQATDRGGDLTLHSPGQLVIYPIFRISDWKSDLHWYLRNLEEAMIATLRVFAIQGTRKEGLTGVWVENSKVAAIGIKVRKWVSTHGIAINVNNDLALFETIVPCGIHEFGVTSLAEVRGEPVAMEQVKEAVIGGFRDVF